MTQTTFRTALLDVERAVGVLAAALIFAASASAQGGGGGGGAGGGGAGGGANGGGGAGINIGNIISNLPAGINLGNAGAIIGNLPAGVNLGNIAGIVGGNGTISANPTIITAGGLLLGDPGSASVIVPSQAVAALAGNTTLGTPATDTNSYLWTIAGGTITSDPTKASVTYTAAAPGTVTLSVAVTVVGASAVTTTSQVTVLSPAIAGAIATPAPTVAANAASGSASVPPAQNGDRTFRWTVSGDAAIVGTATAATVNFKPGTPGLKELTCAVRLQNLVTVTLHSFLVVSGTGASSAVTVTSGSGGGTYPAGSVVDIFADPPAPGFVFDKWTGNTTALGTGAVAASLAHAVVTVPNTPVSLTANFKPTPTWTPTVVTGFNPQSTTNASGQTVTAATTLAYCVPTGAIGVVILLHDTGGAVADWFTAPEQALFLRDLVAAGYGVAALNNVNRTTGAWAAQTALAKNLDALNVGAAIDKLAALAPAPVFLLGVGGGADAAASYAELLAAAAPARPIAGVVLYLSAGDQTLAVTSHVPEYFALASNGAGNGAAGNAAARANVQLMVGRGVTAATTVNSPAPVYANRFRALAVGANAFTDTDATNVYSALKSASLLDANGYPASIPPIATLTAALPAAYQGQAANVLAELSAAYAGPAFFSDVDARVIAFLNNRVNGGANPLPGRMVNLSTLGKIYSVGDSFTLGFTISGTAKATLLIRGVGPALGLFGDTNALLAPSLQVFSGSTQIAANQGWDQGGAAAAAAVASAAAAVGAFALPSGNPDSAVVLSLAPGSYTAKVTGVNGAIGDVLAEVYDVTRNSTRLTNLSTLASINNPGDLLTPGIVVQGANPRTLLMRAVGPGLASLGIPASTLLGNPQIAVLSGSTTVATNSNWSQGGASGEAAALTAVFPAVGAFPLKTGSNDAALVSALAAGNFTLQAGGTPAAPANPNAPAGGGAAALSPTGTVLVEVYEVP